MGRVVLGIHPYAQTAESVVGLINEVRNHWSGGIFCDEWGIPRGNLHDIAAEHSAFLEALWRLGIEGTCVFPWSSAMHDGFDGLIDAEGVPNEIYAAVAGAAMALAGPPPTDEPPAPAILDYRGQLPTRDGQRYRKRDISRVDSAVVHYTAGSPTAMVEDIAAYQVGPDAHLPFPAIAYHIVANQDGSVAWCHDFDVRVWGSDGPGWNERAVHIVYAGNLAPTEGQKRAIRSAIRFTQEQLGRALTIVGHSDTSQTRCPGPLWPSWKADVLP